MIWLLQMIVFGHAHKWKVIKAARVDWDTGAQGFMYACQCETCGKIRKFSVSP